MGWKSDGYLRRVGVDPPHTGRVLQQAVYHSREIMKPTCFVSMPLEVRSYARPVPGTVIFERDECMIRGG